MQRLNRLIGVSRWAGAVLLVAGVIVGFAGNGSRAVAAGDQPGSPAYEELVQRLLTLPSVGAQPSTLQLLPGQTASQFPVSLPLPNGATVVGSAVRTSGNQTAGVTLVLDVPGSQSTVQSFYQQQLTAKGWNPPPSPPNLQHGFQPRQSASPQTIFCPPPGSPNWIVLMVYPMPNGSNDVRLNLNTSSNQTCSRPSAPPPQPAQPASIANPIPILYPPDGVGLQQMGSGGGSNRWTSDGAANTTQSAGSLEDGFAQQLQAAGWTKLDGRDDGGLAWSTWKLPAGDMQGFLYVLLAQSPNQKLLHVEAETANAASAGPIGTSQTAVAVAVPATGAVAPPAVPGR